MKLFNFFKKTKLKGEESSVASNEVLNDKQSRSKKKASQTIETPLSLHPEWELSQEQMYVFRFLANELQPLKPNQLALSGIDIDEEGDAWHVKAFFRSTVDQTIQMHDAELVLRDKEGNVVAHDRFDLSEMGDVPANRARPWVFTFPKKAQLVEEVPADGWTLNFIPSSMREHELQFDPKWEEVLAPEQKEGLQQAFKNLPELPPRTVNLVGFSSAFTDEGDLAVSAFIRNGHYSEMTVENFPLEVIDATGERVAYGSFNLKELTIPPHTTMPWTFIYPKEMVVKENPDFSRWAIRARENG